MNPTDNNPSKNYGGASYSSSSIAPSVGLAGTPSSYPRLVVQPTPTNQTLAEPTDSNLETGLESAPTALTPVAGMSPVESVFPPIIHTPAPKETLSNRFSVFHLNRTALRVTALVLSFIVLVGIGVFVFTKLTTKQSTATNPNSTSPSSQYAIGDLSFQKLNSTTTELQLGTADKLAINGQLLVNNTLVLSPSAIPSTPTTGQLYYNKTTNQPYYYNGTEFISLQPTTATTTSSSPQTTTSTTTTITPTVTSLGGATGDITLGQGLAMTANQLDVATTLLNSLNATNLTTGTLPNTRLSPNVTMQGNTFNSPNQLVQLSSGGLLPILDGSNLTNLSASNLTTGTLADARLTTNVTVQGNSFNGVSQLVQLNASSQLPVISGVNLTNLNGSNVSSGTVADARLTTNVTLQGNSFNGASQLVQLNASSQLPAVSGVNLTNLNGSNIASGTLADARLTTNVTLQANTFNGVSQLVQTTAGGILPVLSGANLTSLNGTNISSGTVADVRLSANVPLLGAVSQTFTGANTFSSASNSFTGNGAGLTSLNGTNISTGTVADARLTTNVTLQGNSFNGASQLVQLTAGGILPILSGANLTSLNGTNISSGTINNTYLVSSGALTVTAGTGLSGGGLVALGGVITLTNSGVLSVTGTANQITVSASTGAVTFSLPQNIAVSSSPTFAGLTLTANLAVSGTITAGSYTRSCPTGYVPVPGNPKFGTTDFCVMKYDASNDGAGNAVSVPNAAPWVSISQITAEDTSRAASGHLLTEAEWMTIATNALWVNANWCSADGSACGNAPGTAAKILAAGHNDNSPAQALTASSTDSQACYGTVTAGTDTTCGSAGTQKRTLTLSNGSVIWDFGGNVWQWTSSWIIGNEQPTVTATPGFGWREYTALTRYGDLNYANPTNRGWNSTQGLGQIYSDGTSTNNTLYGFIRGGSWSIGSAAGAFSLDLYFAPTFTDTTFGFRVAR